MAIKLSSTLPKTHGLGNVALDMIDDPRALVPVIALIDAKELRTDLDLGVIHPVARIRRIEAVLPEDHRTARRLIRRALDSRLGREALPIEIAEELDDAFGPDNP